MDKRYLTLLVTPDYYDHLLKSHARKIKLCTLTIIWCHGHYTHVYEKK